MRVWVWGMLAVLVGVAWGQTPPPAQPARAIFTALRTDVAPTERGGRTFVPVGVIAREFGATVRWVPAEQRVDITRPDAPEIRLTIGARTAQVGTATVALDAPPFIDQGRTLVPLRFIAEAYRIPVVYHAETRSVHLLRGDRVYVLPLESLRSAIYLYDPQAGELVRNGLRVQGQANVFEGALIIEVQDLRGAVLGRTTATAGMGGFYPYSTTVNYNQPGEDAISGRIVVYAEDAQGTGHIVARAEVQVVLASTR
jgi:hypothetical protein